MTVTGGKAAILRGDNGGRGGNMIFEAEFSDGEGLKEYPRPQFARDSYISLNGEWDYAVTSSPERPTRYDGRIKVPYSPESPLSGAQRAPSASEYLHYRTFFTLPEGFNRGRVMLNFGAVDQRCTVYCNGAEVGGHEGGYLPFSVELTKSLNGGENELCVVVADDAASDVYGRGKQSYSAGGIWYTAISGIWQTVWLESVPKDFLRGVKLLPDAQSGRLEVILDASDAGIPAEIAVLDGDERIAFREGIYAGQSCILDVSRCQKWSPDNPQLYRIVITYGQDRVRSYFGLRTFGTAERGGRRCFTLNGNPIYHNGLLDQGYWGDGIYTPATNREMYDCLKAVRGLGFNMLRKHIKVEPLLWYYYCDILGILVWQDMVNGGAPYSKLRINLGPFIDLHLDDMNFKSMGRDNPRSRRQYMAEAEDTIKTLFNCVSLCLWTPFNEGWGQFDAVGVWRALRELDPTRQYDHASGWQDKGGGDVYSRHVYFRKLRVKNDKKRVLAVTEFGGYACSSGDKKAFSYRRFSTSAEYAAALERLYLKEVVPLIRSQGLAATVYTQLCDVEQEVNGLFASDMKCKVTPERLSKVNDEVYAAFDEVFGGGKKDD